MTPINTGWGKSRFIAVNRKAQFILYDYLLIIVFFSIQATVNLLLAQPVWATPPASYFATVVVGHGGLVTGCRAIGVWRKSGCCASLECLPVSCQPSCCLTRSSQLRGFDHTGHSGQPPERSLGSLPFALRIQGASAESKAALLKEASEILGFPDPSLSPPFLPRAGQQE